jgi:hypothetical protein
VSKVIKYFTSLLSTLYLPYNLNTYPIHPSIHPHLSISLLLLPNKKEISRKKTQENTKNSSLAKEKKKRKRVVDFSRVETAYKEDLLKIITERETQKGG